MVERIPLRHASVLTRSSDPAQRPTEGDLFFEGDLRGLGWRPELEVR